MPRALAVSGGGSKGAFAVGVAQAMRERFGITFDLVSGTSTGALLAPFVVTDRLNRAEELYTSFSTDDCFVRQDAVDAVRNGFLLDTAPLRALLDAFLDDALFDAVRRAVDGGRRLSVAAVDVETGALTYFHVGPPPRVASGRMTREIVSRAGLVDAVLASASQPAIMRLPTIDGHRYCDGGVRETAPIQVVIDAGATDVVAVVLSPEPTGAVQPVGRSLLATASRALDLLLTEVVRDDIAEAARATSTAHYLAALRSRLGERLAPPALATVDAVLAELAPENPLADVRATRLTVIRPREELILDSLEFTRADMRRMVRLGLERVDELFPGGPIPIA